MAVTSDGHSKYSRKLPVHLLLTSKKHPVTSVPGHRTFSRLILSSLESANHTSTWYFCCEKLENQSPFLSNRTQELVTFILLLRTTCAISLLLSSCLCTLVWFSWGLYGVKISQKLF